VQESGVTKAKKKLHEERGLEKLRPQPANRQSGGKGSG